MNKTKNKTKKATPPVMPSVKAYIKVLGKVYEAMGKDTNEAISKLCPGNCKGVAVLSVEKDGVRKDKILMPLVAQRLFNSHGMTRELALKNASLMMG